MPTISNRIALEIIEANGYYKDDPRVTAVVKYQNQFNGQDAYAITYAPQTTIGYFESPACIAPEIVWNCYETAFYFTFPNRSEWKQGFMKIAALTVEEARAIFIAKYGKPIFAFCYIEKEFLPQIGQYNLYEIPFGYMPENM